MAEAGPVTGNPSEGLGLREAAAEAKIEVETGSGGMPVLEVRGLTKRFSVGTVGRRRTVPALNRLDLKLSRGEVLGLVGESGSGKTTFARGISFLAPPTAGEIFLEGNRLPLRPRPRELHRYRSRVQMIFQDPYASLDRLHTVYRTLVQPLRSFGVMVRGQERQATEELLEQVGLVPARDFLDRYPYELSGGQRQRVGIARALAVQPLLILADEPTSMLDVSIRLTIMNLLLDLQRTRSLSLVFITHDLAGANYVSDRIAILYAGHMLEVGPASDVMREPRHPYTQLLRQAAPDPQGGFRRGERFDSSGEPPDLTDLPPGCPFVPRCPFAKDVCHGDLPGWREVGPNHRVRCVLYD